MMFAIVKFINGFSSLVKVNLSYSRAGIHYYHLTLNDLDTYLDYKEGKSKLFTGDEIIDLKYVMN